MQHWKFWNGIDDWGRFEKWIGQLEEINFYSLEKVSLVRIELWEWDSESERLLLEEWIKPLVIHVNKGRVVKNENMKVKLK